MYSVGRIAIAMPTIRDSLDSEFLQGIQEQAREFGYDVIVITNASNAHMDFIHSDYVDGENNIYELLSQIKLDGIIFAAGKYAHEDVIHRITDIIKAANIPCLVTERSQEDFPFIFSSDRENFRSITQHIINVHNCRKCFCLTGSKGAFQSEERLAGFMDAVNDAGIPNEDIQVFYGDFWKQAAYELGRKIAEGEVPMPEAVVCASDIMAISLCDSLTERGILVPEQVKITGFDGHLLALTHFPSITTVAETAFRLGQSAVNRLYQIMTGKRSDILLRNSYLRQGSSCGCSQSGNEQMRINQILTQNQIYHDTTYEVFITSNYIIQLSEVDSFNDFIFTAKRLGHLLPKWKWLDLCLCSDWIKTSDKFRTSGYSTEMLLALSKRFCYNDERTGYTFPTEDIVPSLSKPHSPLFMVITPIHNVLQVFGYLSTVYDNASEFKCDYYYNNWCDAIANGLRSLQNKLYTREIERKIEEYASRDKLSGMYNRRGFVQNAPMFFKHLKSNAPTGILLIISCRDKMLSSTSEEVFTIVNAIQISCRPEELSARIGSATFAIFIPLDNETPVSEQAEQWFIHFDKMVKMIFRQKNSQQIPSFATDYSTVHVLQLSYLEQLLDERLNILLKKTDGECRGKSSYTKQLEQILREIKLEPQLDWSIPNIASRLGISESYFQRIYTRQFERSCMDDIITARMNKAKRLLKKTNLHIVEIAEQCGYQNPSSFMKLFKKKFGTTAKEYRNSVK